MENKSTNKRRYYAVREGRKVGVFTKWSDAKQQIERFEGANYKVFDKRKDAEEWVKKKYVGINCGECTSRFVSKEELEQILKHAYRNR